MFWANELEYDITRDTWEEIPPPPAYPSRASSAFNGDELLVVGLNNDDFRGTTAQMAFDPAANTWRELPPSGLNGNALDLETFDAPPGPQRASSILGVDYQNHAAIYDAGTNTWTGQALLEADGRWTVVSGGPGGFRAAAIKGSVFLIGEQFAVYVP